MFRETNNIYLTNDNTLIEYFGVSVLSQNVKLTNPECYNMFRPRSMQTSVTAIRAGFRANQTASTSNRRRDDASDCSYCYWHVYKHKNASCS